MTAATRPQGRTLNWNPGTLADYKCKSYGKPSAEAPRPRDASRGVDQPLAAFLGSHHHSIQSAVTARRFSLFRIRPTKVKHSKQSLLKLKTATQNRVSSKQGFPQFEYSNSSSSFSGFSFLFIRIAFVLNFGANSWLARRSTRCSGRKILK